MPATRCAWSIDSENHARNRLESASAPTNTYAASPHGVSGSSSQSQLDLGAGRMLDIDVRAALHTHARFTMRPQVPVPDVTRERLVAAIEPECDNLVEQHGRPHVRVIDEPLTHVALDPIERINDLGPATYTRLAFARRYARTVLRS